MNATGNESFTESYIPEDISNMTDNIRKKNTETMSNVVIL